MSYTEYKVGYVAEIMQLRDKSEHEIYEYFKCKGIIPDDDYEENGVHSDLEYWTHNESFVPVILSDGVLIMYVFASGPVECESDLDTIINSADVIGMRNVLHDKFNVRESKFFAYSWYNGTDEPCYVDDKYRGE